MVSMSSPVLGVTPFGAALRRWRLTRGASQLALANLAATTTRHVSFLETGRSRPSGEPGHPARGRRRLPHLTRGGLRGPRPPGHTPSESESPFVLWVLLTMVLILALAALVAAYAAFTHRGADVPAAPWLGDALDKAVSAVPTLPGDRLQRER